MKISIYNTIWLPVLLLLSFTAQSSDKPDWVDGISKAYPDSRYISASASASDAQRAKDRALGNLSKIFEARVNAETTTVSDTHVSVIDGNESFTRNNQLTQHVQVRSDKIINGARIADQWKDNELFTYHALAILDRDQAGNNIRQEMNRLDEETQSVIDLAKGQQDKLLIMSSLNKALHLQRERYSLQKMMKVIDTRGIGIPSRWNMAELQGDIQQHLLSLQIGTAVDNDPIGKLENLLASAMGNAGFPAQNNGADYTLVASLEVQDLGFRQGWYWLRGKLSIKLIESNGQVRGRQQWSLKVSALQQNEAESRLSTQVSNKLNSEIMPAMMKFASGER